MFEAGAAWLRFAIIDEIVGPNPSEWQENSEVEIVKVKRGNIIPFLSEIIDPSDLAFTSNI